MQSKQELRKIEMCVNAEREREREIMGVCDMVSIEKDKS